MSDGVKRLLYLLPDVAYAVELVAGKEGGGYTVRDFLQVNGEFMDENVILPASMEKLVEKLQPQAYDLILPDFLFTNTVVNVQKTGDEAVKAYIQDELIPSLEISKESHSIQAFILTEFKGTSKVQLSALEKSLMEPVAKAFGGGAQASIKSISPLSWTLKSLISLEPSISVAQLGAKLYLAQHYIGVDQANEAAAEDAEKLVETVKTLKGAEPSIQTLYLLGSALVEQKLKSGLKDTLPVQQLTSDAEESDMPSYVKMIVEASAKTLSVADYKVPVFIMEAAANAPEPSAPETPMKKTDEKVIETAAELPAPTEAKTATEPELKFADAPAEEKMTEAVETAETVEAVEPAVAAPVKPEDVDLSQFSSQPATEPMKEEVKAEKEEVKMEEKPVPPAPAKNVIKNEPGTHNMVRMIFIGLASFFVTVGIGLGIGLGLLTFTRQDTPEPTPTPTAEVSPTPTPVPSTIAEFDRAGQTILVVNATTRAGYAGQVAADLEEAGFENVDAKNAVGDYETGNYLLMETEDQSALETLSKDSGLDLAFGDDKAVEDPSDAYTIVVVLAE